MAYVVLIGADRLRGGGYVDQYDDNYNNEPGYDHYGERFPPPGHMEGGYALVLTIQNIQYCLNYVCAFGNSDMHIFTFSPALLKTENLKSGIPVAG